MRTVNGELHFHRPHVVAVVMPCVVRFFLHVESRITLLDPAIACLVIAYRL